MTRPYLYRREFSPWRYFALVLTAAVLAATLVLMWTDQPLPPLVRDASYGPATPYVTEGGRP